MANIGFVSFLVIWWFVCKSSRFWFLLFSFGFWFLGKISKVMELASKTNWRFLEHRKPSIGAFWGWENLRCLASYMILVLNSSMLYWVNCFPISSRSIFYESLDPLNFLFGLNCTTLFLRYLKLLILNYFVLALCIKVLLRLWNFLLISLLFPACLEMENSWSLCLGFTETERKLLNYEFLTWWVVDLGRYIYLVSYTIMRIWCNL